MNEYNEHPYFFIPESIMKHNLDRINLDPHLITDTNLIDDNRPYRYQQNTQVQQNPLIIFDNEDRENETNNENIFEQQEMNNENIPQQQHENVITKIINLMKIIQTNTILKNLQYLHKIHHKPEHRQIPDISEFQLELLVKPKIYLILNLVKIHFKIETLLLTFHFSQRKIHKLKIEKIYKTKLKTQYKKTLNM